MLTFKAHLMKSHFQTVMRDYCGWYSRPGLTCDRWGCTMDAAFKVADYMAESYSEHPLDYRAGVGGAGSIIEEVEDLREYLDTLTREQLRKVTNTIGRYLKQLQRAGYDY